MAKGEAVYIPIEQIKPYGTATGYAREGEKFRVIGTYGYDKVVRAGRKEQEERIKRIKEEQIRKQQQQEILRQKLESQRLEKLKEREKQTANQLERRRIQEKISYLESRNKRQVRTTSKPKEEIITKTRPMTSDEYRHYVAGTSYKKLLSSGDLPALPVKISYDVGSVIAKPLNKLFNTNSSVGGQVIGETLLLGGISPVIKTGTAQKSEYVYDYTKGVFKKIKDLESTFDKAFKEKGTKGIAEVLKKIEKDNPNLPKDVKKKLAEELVKKGYVRPENIKVITNPVTPRTTIEIDASGLGELKNVGGITSATTKTPQKTKEPVYEPIKIRSRSKSSTTTTSLLGLRSSSSVSGVTVKARSKVKNDTKPRTNTKTNVIPAIKNLLKNESISGMKELIRFRRLTKNSNKPLIPLIIKRDSNGKRSISKPKNSLFEVFSRRFGKDNLIRVTRSKGEAERTLSKYLGSTLARSGYVTKDKELLPFENLNLGLMFRPSKKEKGRVVQKSKYSLSSGSEVKEIQYFKNKALSKGFKWV